MSRVGSKEINIPESVKINLQDGLITAEGPLGKLESKLNSQIEVIVEGQKITMKPKSDDKTLVSFWGLQRNLVNNLIIGVSEGFSKKLEMNGVGYRAALKGKTLELLLGYSHPINYDIPENIKITVEKQTIVKINGSNKQQVGMVASQIKSIRPPEPYKGKGIKEQGQYILRKEGKKK